LIIFVDTSGFYDLYNRDQFDHSAAVEYYGSARRRVTSNYVLAEYVAFAEARGSSRSDAVEFSQNVLDDSEIELVWVDETLHRQAVELITRRKDKHIQFVMPYRS
jgi:uncharacterized protein